MASGLVFFTGAPSTNSLNWDQDTLLDSFIDPIARFVGLATDPKLVPSSHPQWRSLPLDRQHLTTGLTPPEDFDQHQLFTGYSQSHEAGETSFFTTSQVESEFSQSQVPSDSSLSTQASISQVLSQFYEESYARHEDVPSSQIAPASERPSSFTSDEFSFNSASFESQYQPPGLKKEVPIVGHLTNLKDIPKAPYLSSIQPQTMTVNLIVGIISMPQPRAIKTRRGADVSLVEVLVGDETRSGFGVNFWLSSSQPTAGDMKTVLEGLRPQTMTVNLIVGIISMPQPRAIKTRRGADVSLVEVLVGDETRSGFGVNFWLSSSQPTAGDMKTVLEGLRPQDVVLIRNVALNSFRGKVYGQSLRKEMTKVHLLYRNRVDKTDVGGLYRAADLVAKEGMHPQMDKTRRVREWVLKFVGMGIARTRGKKRAFEFVNETLPPDTQ